MTRTLSLVFATLLAGAAAAASAWAQTPSAAHPPHAIANSQLRVLPRTEAGRHYQLHIGLPASYHQQPERRYPVLFVTDGYWDFEKMISIGGTLVYDKVVPEFITVGLGYAGQNLNYGDLRRWELSPVPFGQGDYTSGHAADFLRTIKTEIIPFLEREYRADPAYRVLAGASMGGLFTVFTMLTEPELFQAYIAATPAVVVGNDWLLQYEGAFARSGRKLPVRLYVTGGGNESPGFLGGILRLNQQLAGRKYPGFTYQFRLIEDERHGGMQMESYTRGLRFAFAPLAPETGPAHSP